VAIAAARHPVSAADFLRRLVSALDRANVAHMIAGSFASTHHGVPRATQDIDVVVDPTPAALDVLLAELSPLEYYVDADTARDALATRGQFNIIDLATGWKADLIIRKDRDFSREELARRQPVVLLGVSTFVSTAEDAIVAKVEWAKVGDSERQLRDVAGMLSVLGESLDLAYIERWIVALGLEDTWRRVRPAHR
jgi:hypothetical protein